MQGIAERLRQLAKAQYSETNETTCIDAAAEIDRVEGGLTLLLDAVKANDPTDEIIWRIQEELRLIRRSS